VSFFISALRRRAIAVTGLAALLSGCAVGIQSGGDFPSVSYTVARPYQDVYHRAQDQADQCLRGKNQFKVRTRLDAAGQSGMVSVYGPLGGAEVARTEFTAVDARHTQVVQTVWGRAPWDQNALQAMRESVLIDTSVCVAYK